MCGVGGPRGHHAAARAAALLPRSQRLPELDYEDLGILPVDGPFDWENPNTARAYAEYERRVETVARESGLRMHELAIARGTFLVWAANLLHGGSPRDDRTLTRKSQVTHYYFAGTVPYTPMFSRRSEDAYCVRRLRDVRTGRWTVPSLDGTGVVFPARDGHRRAVRAVRGPAGALVRATMRIHGRLPESPRNAVRVFADAAWEPR